MTLSLKDRVKQAVTTGGTGAIVLGGAELGFQALGAADDGLTFPYVITDGNAWEVGTGTYANSGTTFTRTTRDASSTGAALNVTTAAKFFVSLVASSQSRKYRVGASWSGAGSAVSISTDIVFVQCHTAGTITKATVLTQGGTGSCVIDVWKDTYANFPPVVGDSIAAAAKPTITAGIKAVDTTLTGWTKDVAAGDIIAFHLDSTSVFTWIGISLEITP